MKGLLIEGGRLVDPSQSIDRTAGLLIVDGVVAAIDPPAESLPGDLQRIDARGCIVAPGLVDLASPIGGKSKHRSHRQQSTSTILRSQGNTLKTIRARLGQPIKFTQA